MYVLDLYHPSHFLLELFSLFIQRQHILQHRAQIITLLSPCPDLISLSISVNDLYFLSRCLKAVFHYQTFMTYPRDKPAVCSVVLGTPITVNGESCTCAATSPIAVSLAPSRMGSTGNLRRQMQVSPLESAPVRYLWPILWIRHKCLGWEYPIKEVVLSQTLVAYNLHISALFYP